MQINSFFPHIIQCYNFHLCRNCCITSSTAGGCKELQCGCSQACVFSVCGALSPECGHCSWQHRGTHRTGITGPGGKTFLCLDQRAQRDSMLKQSRKLIGYTYLVCLCLFGLLFFLSFHWGKSFYSEPNLYSRASQGWRISLGFSQHLGTITSPK